jgi:hypothetical protein
VAWRAKRLARFLLVGQSPAALRAERGSCHDGKSPGRKATITNRRFRFYWHSFLSSYRVDDFFGLDHHPPHRVLVSCRREAPDAWVGLSDGCSGEEED